MAAALRLLVAAAVLHLVLIQPNHPGAATWGAFAMFPLELPAILAALAALPGRQRLLRAALVGALLVLAAQKAADLGMFLALGRGFNPVTDWSLVGSGWAVARGALGALPALGAVLAAAALAAGLVAALWWATGVWTGAARRAGLGIPAAGLALLAAAWAVAEAGHTMRAWRLPFDPPGSAFTLRLAAERVALVRATRAGLAAFRAAAAEDGEADRPGQLARLAGRGAIVVFVESYGRASFDNPLYGADHGARRREGAAKLAAAGLAIRSGWLTSPVEGGQSWLAHATFASGLRVDSQLAHAALLASPRRTLWQIAADAGFRTFAVAPAITLAWPEAGRLGFADRLAAADLGYAGPPFNWVTMPDQFTLAAFPGLLPADPRPPFGMVALISSHAPWVPVPELLPWDALGDGRVFARFTAGAPAPAAVWADEDRIRDQFRQALGYSLDVVFDWAARQGPGGPLLVVLGDHPPAGFVSGVGSRDVPVHLIGPPGLLAAFDGWEWTEGPTPAADLPVWPMEAFRDRLLAALRGP